MLSVENGPLWVPYLLKAMDKMKGMGRDSPWLGGRVHGRASEIFKQHVWVNPYHEGRPQGARGAHRDRPRGVRLRLPARRVHPHPEEFIAGIQKQFADVKKLMHKNAQRLVAGP